MKKNMIVAALLISATSLFAQTNLITDGGFEKMTPGTKNYILNNSGTQKMTGFAGRWFVTFSLGGCPEGCCEGTSQITNADKKEGSNALTLTINKQTNRNDIKIFQTMKAVPAGVYEVSFWVKCDKDATPIAIDVLRSDQASTNNGAEPYTGNFTVTTEWKQIKLKVDITGWTDEERDNMRISIRPNNNKKLPEGPYPKSFWIDDVIFSAVK
jgi:hypothetical protein